MHLLSTNLLFLDPNSATPLYIQLANCVRAAIKDKYLKAGDAIPSERVLMDALNISRGTTRKAFQLLFDDGTIIRNQGSGTFVAFSIKQSSIVLESFTEMVRPTGSDPESDIVGYVHRQPSQEECMALQLDDEITVVELTRVRKINGIPISLQIAVLPSFILPSLTHLGHSLYAYLELQGSPVIHAKQNFKGVIADTIIAKHLDITIYEPLLLVNRTGYTLDDKPIELTNTWCLNEYYNFTVELNKS